MECYLLMYLSNKYLLINIIDKYVLMVYYFKDELYFLNKN